MSSWGNKDDIASPGTVSLSGLTVTGSGTFFANNYSSGDIITIADAGGAAVINVIANATSMTLVSNTELTAGTLSGKQYAVSEKCVYVIDTDTNMRGDEVFGVSVAELSGSAGVASITVTAAGSGFTVRPTVAVAAGATGTATATATGKVVTIAIGDVAGSGYANGDVVTISGGTGTSATAFVTTGAADTIPAVITLVNGGSYTVLPTLDEAATTNSGSGDDALTVDLVIGLNDVTVTAPGGGYTSAPAVTIGGAGGVGATATAVLQSSDREKVAHGGWVRFSEEYTDANGNVRQKSETLVAMSTITGDADDDTGDVALPQ